MKNIKISLKLIKLGIKADSSFSLDFLFGLISSILWIGIPLIFFRLLFLNINDFEGWGFYQVLTLVGTFTIVDGIMMGLLIRGMPALEKDILNGTIDQYLLKPFDTQLFYLFRSVNLVQLVNGFFGVVVLIWGLASQNRMVTVFEWILFLFSLFVGCVIYYTIWLLIVLTSFWSPSNVSRTELFLSIIGMGRYPSSIFKGVIKIFLTYVIPLTLIANPATRIILGMTYKKELMIQILVGFISIIISRIMWKKGLKKYEGTGR